MIKLSEKSTFHETKEVVTRLREPIKFKIVPYATTKVRGHQIQVEMNLSWDQIDSMNIKVGPIRQGVSNCIKLIEDDLKSEYLGKIVLGKEE